MKGKTTALIIILIVISVVSYLFFTNPVEDILSRIPLLEGLYSNTSLTVNSSNGVARVTINGEDYGTTPVEIEELEEGRHEVVLTKESVDENNFYTEERVLVDLYRNTEAIIDMEIGPNGTKHGYILYYTPSPIEKVDVGFLTATTNPESAKLYIDEQFLGSSPLGVTEYPAGEYEISINTEGYEGIKFPVIVREGFNLNISVEQLPIPINITEETPTNE